MGALRKLGYIALTIGAMLELLGTTALADWSNWESLGGGFTSGPSATSPRANSIEVYARGEDNALWIAGWNGTSWNAWKSLGGGITSDPGCVFTTGPHYTHCFARGEDNAMWYIYWGGMSWSDWKSAGGGFTSGPSAASEAEGEHSVGVFARGEDNALWVSWLGYFIGDASSRYVWSDWFSMGGSLTSDPDCLYWAPGEIDCFARGTDNAIWRRVSVLLNGEAQPWESLGGNLTSGPSAVSWGEGRLDIFARGQDNGLWHKGWDGSSWSNWESLGGNITSDPDCVSWGSKRIDCFARGTDNAIWHKWLSGDMPTSMPPQPAVPPPPAPSVSTDLSGLVAQAKLW